MSTEKGEPMRVLRLIHGAGNGVNMACLMTASNMLIGRGQDGDDNSCVCLLIRAFGIPTNDRMPESLLGELYGPLAWEILGTKTDDPDVLRQRAFAFADWAVREVAPIALEACGLQSQAEQLRALPTIDSAESAYAAYAAARAAARAAHAAARAAALAAYAAYAAARAAARAAAHAAARAAYAAYAADAAADAATNAAYAAAHAAHAAHAADAAADVAIKERVWRMCPDIIRRVAAIGDRRPVECVVSADDLACALGSEP